MSNLINFNQNNLTMSSQEIADLVESRHDNVKRTIDTLVESGIIHKPQSEEREYINGLGIKQSATEYNLDKRSSIIVVAQLSPEFTAKLVDRWQELENQLKTRPPIEMSLDEFANLYHDAMKGKGTYQRIQESIKTSEAIYGKKPARIREENPNVKYVRSEGNARNYYAAIELMVAQGADREKATEAVMSAIPKVQFEAKQLPIRANLTVTTTYQLELF